MTPLSRITAILLCIAVANGCDSGLGGSGPGEVEVRVVPYSGEGIPAEGGVEGMLEIDARVFLLRGTIPVPLSSGSRSVSLDLAAPDEVLLTGSSIFSGFYDGVRVVFSNVSARVTGPDLGVPLEVTVDMAGDGSLQWTDFSRVLVADGGTTTLVLEIAADAWISESVNGVVPREAFEAALDLGFRTD